MRARGEEGGRLGLVGKCRGLREENRVLRRMVGWEDLGSEEEDEEGGSGGV